MQGFILRCLGFKQQDVEPPRPASNLCEELVVEIFSRLPTKSLLRFRSVSKSLYSMIGSRDFIRLHALRSPEKFAILHKIGDKKRVDTKTVYTIHSESRLSTYDGITPVKYPFGCNRSTIIGSCNGIICVYEREKRAIHLWNPSIRRKVTTHDPRLFGHCLALGFGFDPIINDYKIVRISKTVATFVYTMKTHNWREIASPTSPFSDVNGSQCLLNGTLHWVVRDNNYHYIMAFDLSSEVFSVIELPEPNWKTDKVTIIKGCLAVITLKDYGAFMWILVKNKTAASWSFEIRLDKLLMTTHVSDCIDSVTTCIESLELLDMGTTCDVIKGSKTKRKVVAGFDNKCLYCF